MGGSSGGGIVRHSAVAVLLNPEVHGQLPLTTRSALDAIFPKHPMDWSEHDCEVVGRAFMWAICNLQ
jgi:hypothetical protein